MRLAGPWAPDAGHQRTGANWHSGSRIHSFAGQFVHRAGAEAEDRFGRRELGLWAEIRQGTVVAGEGERVVPTKHAGRKERVAQVVGQSCLVVGTSPGVGNKKCAQIQQTVLVDGLEIEVLTWAGMDNPDAQTCED